jgi:hypothetical protein
MADGDGARKDCMRGFFLFLGVYLNTAASGQSPSSHAVHHLAPSDSLIIYARPSSLRQQSVIYSERETTRLDRRNEAHVTQHLELSWRAAWIWTHAAPEPEP